MNRFKSAKYLQKSENFADSFEKTKKFSHPVYKLFRESESGRFSIKKFLINLKKSQEISKNSPTSINVFCFCTLKGISY